MNILSNQFLYTSSSSPTPPPSYTYEAYYINNGTATLLGTVTDLSKTFACQDEYAFSNMFVYEGDLYERGTKVRTSGNITALSGRTGSSSYYGFFIEDSKLYRFNSSLSISLINTEKTWLKVCGRASTSSGPYRAFAETTDGLYHLKYTSSGGPVKISDLTGWTKITGVGHYSSNSDYGYGIHNGNLYYLNSNYDTVYKQGTDDTWTDITGGYEDNGDWHGYGINAGKLYKLAGTPTQIGSDTTWTKIGGDSSNNTYPAYAIGINGGKLYRINGATATQVGSSADWKGCSGFHLQGSNTLSLAYDSTALYGIGSNGATTKIMDGEFVYCGENYSSSDGYAVAIRKVAI